MMSAREILERIPSREEFNDLLGFGSHRNEAALSLAGMFSVGVLVGAGLALLFAPKPGHEFRREIGERVNDLRHRAESGAEPGTSA